MPSTDTPPDPLALWDDPCVAFKALRDARQRLLSGEQEAEYEYQGNGQTRRVKWAIVNLTQLTAEMNRARDACAKQCGLAEPGRRFAITAGGRTAGFGPYNGGYRR